MNLSNAVAPDWNLKPNSSNHQLRHQINAVAPDWNLKLKHALTANN